MTHTIKKLTKDDETKWDDYVSNKNCSVYHLCGWRNLIFNEFSHDNLYLFAEKDRNQIIGILPIIRQKAFFWG